MSQVHHTPAGLGADTDRGTGPDASEHPDADTSAGQGAPGEDATAPLRRTDVDQPRSMDEAILDVLRSADGREPLPGAPDPVRTRPGDRIDHYEIIRELGRGAMARVFLARDTKLGRRVAIKILGRGDPAFTERFIVEAQATARCSHENIVVIHEVGELAGRPYMVLEYLEGRSLKTLLSQQVVTPRQAIELITPVVRALACAHAFGIVHRDLKPDNIVVTLAGAVKVLDFGIAKLLADAPAQAAPDGAGALRTGEFRTEVGTVVGTLPYMAPEQWDSCADNTVDHRTDIWAVGITLFEMLTGTHPLEPLSRERLARTADLDEPMPGVQVFAPELPAELAAVVDDCLAKRRSGRIGSARELLERLEQAAAAMGVRGASRPGPDQNPYAGLAPFQEADADWFFGRERDVAQVVTRLRDQPLVGIIGPSGAGKSSLVRAGVAAALKRSGDRWEVLILRPGRDPIAGLAGLLESLAASARGSAAPRLDEGDRGDPEIDPASSHPGSDLDSGAHPPVRGAPDDAQAHALAARLRAEPGYLGAVLRRRARRRRTRVLLFIDQFEELYTLVADPAERRAYTSAITGAADDPATPLRAVVAMRSDLLDRAAEDRRFLDELTRGLMFLPVPDLDGLEAALIRPAELAGYRFESPAMVEGMLDALQSTPGALPLLQFTAAELWEARDRERRLLTQASYDDLGGLAGALARHADAVLTGLPRDDQKLARLIFRQLVTADGTRALTAISELDHLGPEPASVVRLVDHLVRARLLVVHEGEPSEDGAVIEIVHESLIEGWPTLRRWLEQDQEQAAFLDQLRAAARQWEARGRPQGLLWRGEAARDAARWQVQLAQVVSAREAEYLDAVVSLSQRAVRMRRLVIAGVLGLSMLVAVAAVVAAVRIREAERQATEQAALLAQQLTELEARKRETQLAQHELERANTALATSNIELAQANDKLADSQLKLEHTVEQLQQALSRAESEKGRAERESERAQQALAEAQRARAQAERARTHAERQSELAQQAAEAEREAANAARLAAEEARQARLKAEALARDLEQAQEERKRRLAEEEDRRRKFEQEWGPFRDTLE